MWLINSSIGRKVVMSVTGIALILFLTFHASMNIVALISAKGYNMICEFLGANWYAVVATIGLAALVVLHFIYAIWLTLQNNRARGNSKYAVTDKPGKVEWASQNMLVLGFIVIVGMALHLYNFWYNMMFAELAGMEGEILPTNGVGFIIQTFSCPCYTAIYIVWLVALWFHLNHGFWSAMQTLGWSGKIWFERWRCIGSAYTSIVILMFVAVALAFSAGYKPADYEQVMMEQEMEGSVLIMDNCRIMKCGRGHKGMCGMKSTPCTKDQKPCANGGECRQGKCLAGERCGETSCCGKCDAN